MKTRISMSVFAVAMMVAMPAMASHSEHKQVRNDRVAVSQGIKQFDINPFADSKREVRNDRVSYSHPAVKAEVEQVAAQKHRYVRNDHVIITK